MSESKMTLERAVAVLPSLKPTEKLPEILRGLRSEGFLHIVVVDDGSGPDYAQLFSRAETEYGCTVLRHPENQGKGAALRTAFHWIAEQLPDAACVVTADADGQHLPRDIRACAEKCLTAPEGFRGCVLGCRNFGQSDVPWRSRAGNRITCAVFRLCCGIRISDTQTGLRAFPAACLQQLLSISGDRYEYETNVLLEMKRAGMPFLEVSIATVYENDNRGSHYRPFRDSWRIYRLIFRFMLSSTAATLLDYVAFYVAFRLLMGVMEDWRILAATVIARALSSFLNFNLNKNIVFTCRKHYRRTLLRYYALCIPQMLVSAGLLTLLSWLLGTDSSGVVTALKIPVDIILFLVSFQIQRDWVFQQDKTA